MTSLEIGIAAKLLIITMVLLIVEIIFRWREIRERQNHNEVHP